MDIWRYKFAEQRNYTFYSDRHDSYSRIDQIWISNTLVPMVKSVDILPNTFADHSPLELNIWFRRPGSRRWRIDRQILKHDVIKAKLVDEMKTFFQINDDGYPSAKLLWDSFKAFIRGKIIGLTASMKKIDLSK